MASKLSVLPLRKAACHQFDTSYRPAYFTELSSLAHQITALANIRGRNQQEQEELETLISWYAVERDDILRTRLCGRRI